MSCTAGALFVFVVFVFVFVWVRQRAWARSSTASAIYHTCVMSLVTCNWLRGETCGALGAESSDRGANPREASLRRECAWDCGHANAADTGKHAQASKHSPISSPCTLSIWTHWGLSPRPSTCTADVIPLHHVPLVKLRPGCVVVYRFCGHKSLLTFGRSVFVLQ